MQPLKRPYFAKTSAAAGMCIRNCTKSAFLANVDQNFKKFSAAHALVTINLPIVKLLTKTSREQTSFTHS